MRIEYFKRGECWRWYGTAEEKHVPEQAGFGRNPLLMAWTTRSPDVVRTLMPLLTESARAELAERDNGIKESWAEDAPGAADFKCPPGRSYYPYQRAAIHYALPRKKCILGDEPGLGKTIEAIGVMNQFPMRRVLVLCPASVKIQWTRMLDAWMVDRALSVTSIWGSTGDIPDRAGVFVMNYDIAHGYLKKLYKYRWDLVICDEAHYLKNDTARRTKVVFGDGKHEGIPCDRMLLLTGTPVERNPEHLYPLLKAIDPVSFESRTAYVTRYCHQRSFHGKRPVTVGAKNLDELNTTLRSRYMIRRLVKDVAQDLPDKHRQIIEIPCPEDLLDQVGREKREYDLVTESIAAIDAQIGELHEGDESYAEAMSRFSTLKKIQRDRMSTESRLTGMAKVGNAAKILKEMQREDRYRKVVVFAIHTSVVAALEQELLGHCVTFTGKASAKDKDKRLKMFRDDDAINFMIGNIHSLGTGVDGVQEFCHHCFFAEFPWDWSAVTQAEKRLERPGQKNFVLSQFFVLQGSLDAYRVKKFLEGRRTAEAILDGGQPRKQTA